MEIPLGRARWLRGLIAFALILAAVAGLMVWMFLWFTPSVALAVTLVCIMLVYMIGFGWLMSRADARG